MAIQVRGGTHDGLMVPSGPRRKREAMHMGKLEGKIALVTGSGRNIGRATALKLAEEGAHVVVNARTNQAEAEAVAREAQARGVKALAIVADVARKDQVDAMIARAMS
jgi:3-oxoacyl-[acyl-carrier protein] reductase